MFSTEHNLWHIHVFNSTWTQCFFIFYENKVLALWSNTNVALSTERLLPIMQHSSCNVSDLLTLQKKKQSRCNTLKRIPKISVISHPSSNTINCCCIPISIHWSVWLSIQSKILLHHPIKIAVLKSTNHRACIINYQAAFFHSPSQPEIYLVLI